MTLGELRLEVETEHVLHRPSWSPFKFIFLLPTGRLGFLFDFTVIYITVEIGFRALWFYGKDL